MPFQSCEKCGVDLTDFTVKRYCLDCACKLEESAPSASTNSAMDAICTCSEAACRYRSATEPTLCLDPTDLCKSKRHQ